VLTESDRHGSPWVLAVDFGTSSTAAAIGRDGGAELVGVDGGLPRMLSNVFWQESTGRLLLGDVADHASAQAPWCFERSPKVKLGQQFMLLGDRRVRVSEAVGAVLGRVAQDAIRVRGGDRPATVRLTHPVRWGHEKRDALVEAAAIAGLDSPELVLEPVAAAMHYASERLAPGQHVAVYDLGGGTLDTAVLQRTARGFEVVGEPGGRDGFGGEEFDHRLYRFLGAQLPDEEWLRLRTEPEEDGDSAWPKARRQFQRNVRRAKELLTHNPQVDVDVPPPVNRGLTLRVEELESLIRLDLEDSVRELERTIESAGLAPWELTAVYLAGGSSQIPLVSRLIGQRLGVVPEHLNDAKAVICLGAALSRESTQTTGRQTQSDVGPPVTGLTEHDTSGVAPAIEIGGATDPAVATDPVVATDPAVADPVVVTDPAVAADPAVATDPVVATGPAVATDPAVATELAGATETAEPAEVADLEPGSSLRRSSGGGGTVTDGTETADDMEIPGGTEIAAGAGLAGATKEQDADAEPVRSTSSTRPPPTALSDRAAAAAHHRAESAPPSSGSRSKVPFLIAGVVAAVIIVAVVVFAGGGSKSKPKPPTGPVTHASGHSSSSGPLTISYGSAWSLASGKVTGASTLGGSSPPVTLKSGQLTLAAGQLKRSAPIPGGAPPPLLTAYGHPATTSSVTVAGAKANEYAWAPSGKRVEAYILPTSAADIAIICQAPFDGASLSSCTQLAQSAKLSGARLLAPGPVHTFGTALNRKLSPVVSLRSRLHGLGGSTLGPRAGKAAALASADTRAAAAIAAVSAPARYGKSVSSLGSALRAEARQLTSLANAARGDHRDAYASAAKAVGRASGSLQSAAARFAAFGLTIHGLNKLSLDGPPPLPVIPSTAPTVTPTVPTTPTFTPTTSPPPSSVTPTTAPPPPPTGCSGTCTSKPS
jgi:Hsp70 protein